MIIYKYLYNYYNLITFIIMIKITLYFLKIHLLYYLIK